MKESSTYQAILEEGRMEGYIEGMRWFLISQGKHKGFGEPLPHTRASIESISNIERLEQLGIRLLYVNSWDELLTS